MASEADTSIFMRCNTRGTSYSEELKSGVQNMKFTINNAITLIIKHFKPNPAYIKQDKMTAGNLMPCVTQYHRPRFASYTG